MKNRPALAAALVLLAYFGPLLLLGCLENKPGPNSIPLVGDAVSQAKSHVESAEQAVTKARPESSRLGQAFLGVASDEHAKALDQLATARADLARVQSERDALARSAADAKSELAKVKAGWGYRLQTFVTWAYRILLILVAFHFLGGIAGLLIPGPIGAAVSVAAAVVNPFAWFQVVRDNVWFRKGKA